MIVWSNESLFSALCSVIMLVEVYTSFWVNRKARKKEKTKEWRGGEFYGGV